jgi:hypothetical protein
MYSIHATRFGVFAIILFGASCALETSTSSSVQALGAASSRDNQEPVIVEEPGPDPVRGPVAQARVPGAKKVGHYDIQSGSGQGYQVPPIVAGGGTVINVFDPTGAVLADLNVLWADNPDNFGYGFEFVARTPDIAAAVQSGMVLVIHDRHVANAAAILPAGAGFTILNDTSEGTDINVRDASTAVTANLDNLSLDGGNLSSHGFAQDASLPAQASRILTSTSVNRIVTFCYPVGRGAVVYSTIPLDFYLQGFFGGLPPEGALRNIYAPNVVRYAVAGACSQRRPGPTPNSK